MEAWAVVSIVIPSYLLTLLVTYMQLKHSRRLFEKQLERAREVDYRGRRQEVRSEPLLRLRGELARMTARQRQVIRALDLQHTQFGITAEQAKYILREVSEDFNKYSLSGDFQETLFALDDIQLINMAEEVINRYIASWVSAEAWLELKAEEKKKAREALEENSRRVAEIQSLINRRLEEL